MSARRIALAFAFVLLFAAPALAQSPQWCSAGHFIEQQFPAAGPTAAGERTGWRLCWRWERGPGLIISHAFFRRQANGPWIRVLWDMRLGEVFVPYHTGSPRFLDVSLNFNFVPLVAADCPAAVGGTILGGGSELCKQVKDRGVMWKSHFNKVRRGEELVLWSVMQAEYYNYILEYAFRDDGMIVGRLGATATNRPVTPTEAHMHNPIWRLDVDLDGFCCDTVMTMNHVESGLTGDDKMATITNETGIVWNDENYTALHIIDASLHNGVRGDPQSGFHLMPLRYGTPRHDEDFTKKDFWVTRYRATELYGNLTPTYVNNAENVANADVVLWYWGTIHHMFRREDGRTLQDSTWEGSALVMWTEFQFKPMFLFPKTPLFP